MRHNGSRTDPLFDAALAVFSERSFQGFTHQAVADRAGSEAGVLERRWPEPADLLVDALNHALGPLPADPGNAGLRAELLFVATRLAQEFATHGDVIVGVMTELRRHPALDQAFRERFLLPRIDCARKAFGQAMLRGELRPEADPRLVLSLVPALLTYRVLLRDPAPDEQLAERLVDAVLMPLLALSGTAHPVRTDSPPGR